MMQQSLIVGFGRAGRDLHLRCLEKAYADNIDANLFDQRVGVVDPYLSPSDIKNENLFFFSTLSEVTGFDPASTVVHICTPPDLHTETLKQVAELGFTKCLIEKPLATTRAELKTIHEIQHQFGIDLIVVANWLASSLTTKLIEIIKKKEYGPLLHITAEQNKARLSRTLANPNHGNAFDVEIPHLVALALCLGGSDVNVLTGETAHMLIGNRIFPHMGKARITLLHKSGVTSDLISNLETPVRQRCIKLYFKEHQVFGYYPCSQDDSYSWLNIYTTCGRFLSQQVMYDDPLSNAFTEYYKYFDGLIKKPVSDLEFNARVVTAICEAKSKSGLILDEEDIEHEVIV
ncbi:Gfo/Idh/MocA family protein [Halalkalibacter alkalisediminis]|uniref:Gfo/Idh/MocA family protein n=1 Tax=Halalkalibacter alkalisediminis TaxID=935616 RepID=A0ABV6NP32_9BACI|nr:Gfo/Idh/MocA family oxidoreductase [Halalkalibacter alkalisediminis]